MKNSGTPIGTVIAIACNTDPLRTPRRTLALFSANVAADNSANRPPSIATLLVSISPIGHGRSRRTIARAARVAEISMLCGFCHRAVHASVAVMAILAAEPAAGIPKASDLVARARAIGRIARERARQTEADRRVAADMIERMREADLFRLMQPEAFGGFAYGFDVFADIVAAIASG